MTGCDGERSILSSAQRVKSLISIQLYYNLYYLYDSVSTIVSVFFYARDFLKSADWLDLTNFANSLHQLNPTVNARF